MNNYDFDIANYSREDLKNFLQLGNNYSANTVIENANNFEKTILHALKTDKHKTNKTEIENQLISFLNKAKLILIKNISKTPILNMGNENKQVIYNNSAKESVTSYIEPIPTYQTSVVHGVMNPLKKRTTTYSLCMNTLFKDKPITKPEFHH